MQVHNRWVAPNYDADSSVPILDCGRNAIQRKLVDKEKGIYTLRIFHHTNN